MGIGEWLSGKLRPEIDKSVTDLEEAQEELERVQRRQREVANRLRALQVEAKLVERER